MNQQALEQIWNQHRGHWVAFNYDFEVIATSPRLGPLMEQAYELDSQHPPVVAKMHKKRRGFLTVIIGPDESGAPKVEFHPKATEADMIELIAEYADYMMSQQGTDVQRIRRWAQETGHTVGLRGRVSAELKGAYEKAHPSER
ncbi:histone-like nucleoid-structuring protein Lsr2 [Streptomyces sp. NPDC047072]|uniref:Lsr2 family DNA-binding protein n=1 Tax=Streptomyces sp. NPDC047072 TaxID=3154809 RepID=UPI00340C8D1F